MFRRIRVRIGLCFDVTIAKSNPKERGNLFVFDRPIRQVPGDRPELDVPLRRHPVRQDRRATAGVLRATGQVLPTAEYLPRRPATCTAPTGSQAQDGRPAYVRRRLHSGRTTTVTRNTRDNCTRGSGGEPFFGFRRQSFGEKIQRFGFSDETDRKSCTRVRPPIVRQR